MTTRRAKAKPRQALGHVPESEYVHDDAVPRIEVPGLDQREREGLGKTRHRETADLRAVIAETVLQFTTLLRRDQIARGVHPDRAQEIVEEYDPVVAMALIGVRSDVDVATQLTAHSNVSKFVRPTLKSVEVLSDVDKLTDAQRRNDAARDILGILDSMAIRRRAEHDALVKQRGVVLDQPEPIKVGEHKLG